MMSLSKSNGRPKLYDDVIGPKVAAVRGFSANQSNGSMISLSGDERKKSPRFTRN